MLEPKAIFFPRLSQILNYRPCFPRITCKARSNHSSLLILPNVAHSSWLSRNSEVCTQVCGGVGVAQGREKVFFYGLVESRQFHPRITIQGKSATLLMHHRRSPNIIFIHSRVFFQRHEHVYIALEMLREAIV